MKKIKKFVKEHKAVILEVGGIALLTTIAALSVDKVSRCNKRMDYLTYCCNLLNHENMYLLDKLESRE